MFHNIETTPPKRRVSLVNKSGTLVPQKADTKTLLEEHGYELQKLIGEGEFTKVKLATCKKHGKVAVKIIDKRTAEKEYLEKCLHREVEIMLDLKHPNIIQIIEGFETPTKVYIVMEFAPNGDLCERINDLSLGEHRTFTESEAKPLFFQLVTAVAFCHERNVAHRDIKPDNILLDADDHVKLADFAYAGRMSRGPLCTGCGTADYTAPELMDPDKAERGYDGRAADVWSMGATLYVMLEINPPFDETQMRSGNYGDKVKFSRKVSKECKTLVRKCLTPDPRKRITIKEIFKSDWLKKVPKKCPSTLEFTTSETSVTSDIRSRTNSMRCGSVLLRCASTYSSEDVTRERRDSTLVSDVVHAAKDDPARLARRQLLMDASSNPLEEIRRGAKKDYDMGKEIDQSVAAHVAKMAAQESRDMRRKSVELNQLDKLQRKMGKVIPPAN